MRCHGGINGLISDFMLAEHSSCSPDKGQVQDEVRGDARRQSSLSETEIRPPSGGECFWTLEICRRLLLRGASVDIFSLQKAAYVLNPKRQDCVK